MKAHRKQIELVSRASDLLEEARGCLASAVECGRSTPELDSVSANATSLALELAKAEVSLRAELALIERETFGDKPVLQVAFTADGKRTVRIVVARPSKKCPDASISLVQFDGVCAMLGVGDRTKVRASARFAIAILDHLGFVCAVATKDGTKFTDARTTKK